MANSRSVQPPATLWPCSRTSTHLQPAASPSSLQTGCPRSNSSAAEASYGQGQNRAADTLALLRGDDGLFWPLPQDAVQTLASTIKSQSYCAKSILRPRFGRGPGARGKPATGRA